MDRNLQTFINFLDKSVVDIEKGIIKRASKRVVKELLPEDEKDLLKIAGSLEKNSEHPLAEAILDHAQQ